MHDSNQTPPDGDATRIAEAAAPEPGWPRNPDEPSISLSRALVLWLAVLLVFGLGGLIAGQQELALLAATAGLFLAAQATDVSAGWRDRYFVLGWVVPGLGFLIAVAIGLTLWHSELPFGLRAGLAAMSALVAGLAVLLVPPAAGDAVARRLFGEPQPGHVLRLTARSVVLALALAIPGWFGAQIVMEEVLQSPEPFLERVGLGGGLIGYVLLAFAGVGFLVRRNLPATLRRLGVTMPGARDLFLAVGAVGLLWGLNTGADLLQHAWFPALWESDRRVTQAIASNLSFSQAVLLGLSAGIGEEITMRGALQPRLGIVLTSLLFAALHVQYSWFGMVVIFALGLVLGGVRRWSSTSVAMIAHIAYDVIAVMTN